MVFPVVAIAIVALVTFSPLGDWVWTAFLRDDHPQGLDTISGRLPRWEAGWATFLDRPILGYGAYAAQRFAIGSATGDSELTDVLNTYLDVLTGTGVIGLLPIVAVVAGTSWFLAVPRCFVALTGSTTRWPSSARPCLRFRSRARWYRRSLSPIRHCWTRRHRIRRVRSPAREADVDDSQHRCRIGASGRAPRLVRP